MKILLDLIAPHHCLSCGTEGSLACATCMSDIVYKESSCYICDAPTVDHKVCDSCNKTNLNKSVVLSEYEGLLKELIYALKFNNSKASGKLLAEMLYNNFQGHFADVDIVTHLPTATKRARYRGYDQSAVIAKKLAQLLGIKYQELILRTDQSRQLGLSRKERLTNKPQFKVIKDVSNKNILIVDDVVTTGTTISRVATVLKKSGASSIIGAAVAKVSQ